MTQLIPGANTYRTPTFPGTALLGNDALETLTNGTAGETSFLENREKSTRVGAVAALGGEYRLGPGAATLTVDCGGSDLPHLVTGEVQTTAVGPSLGYRLFF